MVVSDVEGEAPWQKFVWNLIGLIAMKFNKLLKFTMNFLNILLKFTMKLHRLKQGCY